METICLLLSNRDEQALLKGVLGDEFSIVIAPADKLPEMTFDIVIIDAYQLNRYFRQLQEIKQSQEPVFLPILLLTWKREIDLLPRDLWDTIDEVITSPIEIPELQKRILLLLRMRENTAQLYHLHTNCLQRESVLKESNKQLLYQKVELQKSQDNLHKSEERFRSIFESNMLAITFWKSNGVLTEANQAFCKLIGCTIEDVSAGKVKWSDFTSSEKICRDQNRMEKCAETDVCTPYEMEFIHSDGHHIPVLIGCASIAGGKDHGVAFVIELTKHNVAEVESLKERRLLNSIIDGIPIMITLYDPSIKKIEFNKTTQQILGYTKEDIERNDIMELAYPDPEYRKLLKRYMLSLEPGFKDLVMTAKNGEQIDSSWANIKLPDGRQVGIGIDIRERKKAENALRESEDRLRFALESTHTGTWDIDLVTHSAYHSLEHDRIFGYNELLSKWTLDDFLEHTLPEYRQTVKKMIEKGTAEHTGWTSESRIRRVDGQIRWIWFSGNYRIDSSGRQRVAGIIQDITERKNLEVELASRKEFLEKLINNVNIAISVKKGYDLVFTYVNHAYQAINSGVGMIGKKYSDVFTEAGQRDAIDMQRKVLTTGEPWEIQRYHAPVPGRPDAVWEGRVVRLEPSIEEDEPSILSIVYDITEQAKAEEELRKSRDEALQRRVEIETVLQAIPISVAVYNKDGTIRDMNAAYKELIPFAESHRNLPLAERHKKMNYHNEQGEPLSYQQLAVYQALQGSVVRDQMVYFTDKKDQEHWISANASPIIVERKISGAVVGIVDITYIKKAEYALRESEERFRTLADNITQFAWMADAKGWIFWYNRRWYDYTGTTPEEAQGWGWKNVLHPDYVNRVVQKLQHSFDTGEFWEDIFPMKGKDGKYRWFLSRAVPIRNEKNEIVRWLGTNTDITDMRELQNDLQKRTDELAAVNKDLESFSYSVAHDLRNPLRTIKGFISFFEEDCTGKLDEECRDYIQRINNGADRMSSIIDDMLVLAKISRQEMETKKLNLSETARLAIDELRKAQPERTVDVTIRDTLETEADPRLMSVVLSNLLGNAWKYTGKVEKPKIEFGSLLKDGQTVYYVKDNGAGFDMSKAGELFIPFKRLHSDVEFKGTGVGLAIVERAISRHGGKIWAESEINKGATFYFTL